MNDFEHEIRNAFSAEPDPEIRTKHLAAMKAAFGMPATAPARAPRGRFVRRVAVATAACLSVGGSALAATGSLPAPAQNAVASVAREVGLSIPHTAHATQVTNPRAVQNPGVQFANAKKRWLDCEKSGVSTCGPKPQAGDFVHPSPEPSLSPEASEQPEGADHGQGAEHRHNQQVSHPPHPTDHGEGEGSPEPSRTPHADGNGNGHGNGHGHGGDDHPEPSSSPGD
jgi:hypothetical protein